MAEKEYIEREAAIKRFNFAVLDCLGMEPTIRAGDIIKELESIPAADVRPVVLCRDCKYWKQWDNTMHYLCTYVAGAKFIRKAEDFCSRGEKREES